MTRALIILFLALWFVTLKLGIKGFMENHKECGSDWNDIAVLVIIIFPIIGSIFMIVAFEEYLKEEDNN